jgi:hypothetical protein
VGCTLNTYKVLYIIERVISSQNTSVDVSDSILSTTARDQEVVWRCEKGVRRRRKGGFRQGEGPALVRLGGRPGGEAEKAGRSANHSY